MNACRIGQVEARASGSHHSRVVGEAQGDSPVGGLQVSDSLWRAADSRNIYHAEEYKFGGGRPPCMTDSPAVVDNL